jgi:hypothetical protein
VWGDAAVKMRVADIDARTALGRPGAATARLKRTGAEKPNTRAELYEEVKRRKHPGRSKTGRLELLRGLRRR